MALEKINIGTIANDGTGDTLRAAGEKINSTIDALQFMTEAEFMALAEQRRQTFVASGVVGSIDFSDFYAPELTANTLPILASKQNINGYKVSLDEIDIKFPEAPIATNLITNGTFDTDTSGWTGVDCVLSVASGELVSTYSTNTQYNYTSIPTEIGKRYKVELGVRASQVVLCNVRASQDSFTGLVLGQSPIGITSIALTRHSFEFVATKTTTYITLFTSLTSGGISYLSDVSVIDLGKVERQDLIFLESWHEKIADKDIVYPYGNTQSLLVTDPATGLTTINGSFAGYATYSLFGNWQASGGLIGKGLVWSTMSDANKRKFVSDPENNVYLAEDGEMVQVRYRIRVVEGLGVDWVNAEMRPGSADAAKYSNSKVIVPKGIKTTISDDLAYGSGWFLSDNYTDVQVGAYAAFSGTSTTLHDISSAYKGLCFAIPIALVSR